jgi:topoisomerase IA-like protein
VALYSGRYGPYVKHGKVNATLPDPDSIGTVTLEEAVALLAAKSGKSAKPKSKAKTSKPAKPAGRSKLRKAA